MTELESKVDLLTPRIYKKLRLHIVHLSETHLIHQYKYMEISEGGRPQWLVTFACMLYCDLPWGYYPNIMNFQLQRWIKRSLFGADWSYPDKLSCLTAIIFSRDCLPTSALAFSLTGNSPHYKAVHSI